VASVVALVGAGAIADAARRPRYGGELRVETRAVLETLDPAVAVDDPLALQFKEQLVPAVFETLVRIDEHGKVQPQLAASWTHDVARKRWVFAARPFVILHNGPVWSPTDGMEFPDDRPIEQILRDLARPQSAIVVHGQDGTLVGTGPFHIASFTPNKEMRLEAHESYWGGRPFLDAIQIQMGREFRDQELDFDLKKTDVAEAVVTDQRRWRQKGAAVALSAPDTILALAIDTQRVSDPMREALALSIDREAIHSVLLQSQGEISGALLPRWLSGYSFLFPAQRNLARARQLVAGGAAPTFAYDRQDAILRAVGGRIAVNAMEAGIVLRNSNGAADVRLLKLPVTSRDGWNSLSEIARTLKASPQAAAASLYEAERSLMENYRVIPLVHLPQAWVLNSQVTIGPPRYGIPWADAWLDPQKGAR
jgi:MarR-like DNA-binding transcriptional regulator SgrR of sgrS sRNA